MYERKGKIPAGNSGGGDRVGGGAGRHCLCFNRTGIGGRSTDRRLDSGRTGLEISGNGRNDQDWMG